MHKITFDEKKIHEFLNSFYKATGVPIAALNINHDKTVRSMYQSDTFCSICMSFSPKFRDCICRTVWGMYLKHAEKTHNRQIFTCPLGFYEAMIPIVEDDETIVCFIIGCVREKITDNDYFKTMTTIESMDEIYKLPEAHRLASDSFYRTPELSYEKFCALCDVVELCAKSLYENHAIKHEYNSMFENFQKIYALTIYSKELSLQKIANEMNTSVSNLSRCLKSQTGLNFTQYITRDRIAMAKKLLLKSDMKVKQVADAIGIDDANYFSRLFKKETGMTCEEFRKKGFTS